MWGTQLQILAVPVSLTLGNVTLGSGLAQGPAWACGLLPGGLNNACVSGGDFLAAMWILCDLAFRFQVMGMGGLWSSRRVPSSWEGVDKPSETTETHPVGPAKCTRPG